MSLSREDRIKNLVHALTLFVGDVGDQYYKQAFINGVGTEYEKILPTTWQELLDKYYLTPVAIGACYVLTASGWLEGIRLAGLYDDPAFNQRLGRVSKALKDRVKGRNQQAIVSSYEIAKESGTELGFVQNIIDSKLLRYKFKQVPAEWARYNNHGTVISIPINFGLETI